MPSFDNKEINVDDIVYQIVPNSTDPKDIHLRPCKVLDVSQKGRIELLFLDSEGKLGTWNDRCANVCVDPEFLINHWLEFLNKDMTITLPLRIERLSSPEFLQESKDKLTELLHITGKELQEDVEI